MKQLVQLMSLALVTGLTTTAHAQMDRTSELLMSTRAEVPNLAADAARDYRERARFPAWSQPVPVGHGDPLLLKREPTVQTLPQGDDWSMSVRASGIAFQRGQTALLFASVHGRAGLDEDFPAISPHGLPGIDWQISGVIATPDSEELGRVEFRDDGIAPDQKAGDGVHTARFEMPAAHDPAIGTAENLGVFVTARNTGGDELKAMGGLLYSHPAAHLTGRYRDSVVDGDLVIQAEVEVLAEGRFHLAGTLDAASGHALASARVASRLEPGTYWMDLRFYGLALSERRAAGSLSLGSVTLTTANGIPNALGPVVENAYKTDNYKASRFHRREFGRAGMLEAARRLERDAARHGAGR